MNQEQKEDFKQVCSDAYDNFNALIDRLHDLKKFVEKFETNDKMKRQKMKALSKDFNRLADAYMSFRHIDRYMYFTHIITINDNEI